jgi:hypothetical protein
MADPEVSYQNNIQGLEPKVGWRLGSRQKSGPAHLVSAKISQANQLIANQSRQKLQGGGKEGVRLTFNSVSVRS